MPGKHVRFALTNDVYLSPAPPTPSPSFSISSLPSTEPLTPSPLSHFGYAPLPPTPAKLAVGPVRVNPVVGYSLHPPFAWNISRHPLSPNTLLPSHVLAEPATNPPLASITIKSVHIPWSITVTPVPPSHKPNGFAASFVTVEDVLLTLYRALRLPVRPLEFENLPSHDARYHVNNAYRARTYGNPEETAKGLKRIDFFGIHQSFLGLSSTPHGPDVWLLNVT
jgi:hypothetical protein